MTQDLYVNESYLTGAVTLVGGAGGLAAGGFLIQKLRLKLMGIMKMCLLFMLLASVLGGFGFFIGCPQDRFAGITSVYGSAASVFLFIDLSACRSRHVQIFVANTFCLYLLSLAVYLCLYLLSLFTVSVSIFCLYLSLLAL